MTIVAWDFDGVLNRNFIDGRYVWADGFEEDIGQSRDSFERHVFTNDFIDVIVGREDLRDRVQGRINQTGRDWDADTLLAYWFARDARPDLLLLGITEALAQIGVRQVIATNNETRRAHYIEHQMGFGARVEHIFASGRMGVAKPDPVYFARVTETLGTAASDMLLVDDHPLNIEAAMTLGWSAFHFTPETAPNLAAHLPL